MTVPVAVSRVTRLSRPTVYKYEQRNRCGGFRHVTVLTPFP